MGKRERRLQQREIIPYYEARGCTVYETSSAKKPVGITPGIPDLIVFHPEKGLFFHEVKAKGGRQSRPQEGFEKWCQVAGVTYLLGGLGTAAAFFGDEVS